MRVKIREILERGRLNPPRKRQTPPKATPAEIALENWKFATLGRTNLNVPHAYYPPMKLTCDVLRFAERFAETVPTAHAARQRDYHHEYDARRAPRADRQRDYRREYVARRAHAAQRSALAHESLARAPGARKGKFFKNPSETGERAKIATLARS